MQLERTGVDIYWDQMYDDLVPILFVRVML